MANKNQKKVDESNKKILANIQLTIIIINIIYFVFRILWSWESFGFFSICGFLILNAVYYFTYRYLVNYSQPTITEEDYFVEDLNKCQGSFAEYCFDIFYIQYFVQITTIFSNWFWLVYLVLPGFALYKIFGYLLMFWKLKGQQNQEQPNYTPEQLKQMEKKQRKMDLREKRMERFHK